jgi:hypothetical protein
LGQKGLERKLRGKRVSSYLRVLFHLLLDPSGLPMALVVSVLALIVLWQHRGAFAGLVKSRA